ncbi:MAG: hypothetical protein EZS28_052651, partial [Streblomastix strix]
LFLDTAYAEFKPKKQENPDTNIDLSKINDKEEYNTLKKRKEEVKSVICFMIENFSKKLDVEKPKEDQKHNTYVTEDFEFSLGPFTESGSNESTYKRDDEEDDEDEGE